MTAALMHPTIAPYQIDVRKLHRARQLAASRSSIGFIAGHSALAPAAPGLRPSFIRGRSVTTLVFIVCVLAQEARGWDRHHSFHGSHLPASAIWRRDAGKSNTLCWSDYIDVRYRGGDQLGPQTHQFGLARDPRHLLLGCQCGVGD
jgi:hypothetical protein